MVLSVILDSTYAYAETSKIKLFGKYNALYERTSYQLDNGTWNEIERILYFENRTEWTSHTDFSESSAYMSKDIGVGYHQGSSLGMYIVFDSDEIPKSDWWTDVTINSVELKALVQEIPNFTSNKTFVTASSCNDNNWYNDAEKDFLKRLQYDQQWREESKPKLEELDRLSKDNEYLIDENVGKEYAKIEAELDEIGSKIEKLREETFAWKEGYCHSYHQPLDSVIIDRQDLPNVYVLDVTSGITDAISTGSIPPIIEVSAWPLEEEITELLHHGFGLFFKSALDAEDPFGGIGANAEPLFIVTYTTEPTMLKESLDFTLVVLIPVLSIIVPSIIWFYRKAKRSKNKSE
jgi:hypothetical protein